MEYQIKIPSCVYGGEGCIKSITEIIKKEKAEKILVFTDQGIRNAGLLDKLAHFLDESGAEYQVFDNLAAEPTYQDVERVIQEAEDYKGDLIVAIGGGSVMEVDGHKTLFCAERSQLYSERSSGGSKTGQKTDENSDGTYYLWNRI